MVIVISKSGGTVETQNGQVEVRHFFEQRGLNFFANAVRITQKGSPFDTAPDAEKWLASFPLWDWVGGRTSVLWIAASFWLARPSAMSWAGSCWRKTRPCCWPWLGTA